MWKIQIYHYFDYSVLAKIAPIIKTETVECQFMYRRIDNHRHSFSNIINDCQMETVVIYNIFFIYQRK